jgi:tRNA(Ile)-lysidine synthase
MELKNLNSLRNKKNLLAFSGGTDSSALYHSLVENNIEFDIIIVNYNTRETSLYETKYALDLVNYFNSSSLDHKFCFTKSVVIEDHSNFEKKARDIRHTFFEETIAEYGYDNLITGHNLNDKMEWFLMQLTKGAGIRELFGMEPVSTKENKVNGKEYYIVRPLISTPKEEILSYLEEYQIKHFFDESNNDQSYKRNFFRKNYVEELIKYFSTGISRSFDILEKEVNSFEINIVYIDKGENFSIVEAKDYNYVSIADLLLKRTGYVMSGSQRETFYSLNELVFSIDDKWLVVSYNGSNRIILSPYLTDVVMNKKFKEKCRKENINPKHRPFFFQLDYSNFFKVI